MATWKAIEARTDTVMAAHRDAVDDIYMSNAKFGSDVVAALDRIHRETSRQLREVKTDCLRRIDTVDGWSSQGRSNADDSGFDLSDARAALENNLDAIEFELDAVIGIKAALRRMIAIDAQAQTKDAESATDTKRPSGLGRGIEALIPAAPAGAGPLMTIEAFETRLGECLEEVYSIGAISRLAYRRAKEKVGVSVVDAAA